MIKQCCKYIIFEYLYKFQPNFITNTVLLHSEDTVFDSLIAELIDFCIHNQMKTLTILDVLHVEVNAGHQDADSL